jgi:hypothetical protein
MFYQELNTVLAEYMHLCRYSGNERQEIRQTRFNLNQYFVCIRCMKRIN